MRSPIAHIAAFAFAASAFLPFTATAAEAVEPSISNPNQVVTDVTEDGLIALLRELGVEKIETRDLANGRKQVVFWDGAMPYNMTVVGCDIRPGKCVAIALVALLETSANAYSLDAINSVNKSNAFVTVVKVEAAKIGAGRIDLIDGGVTRKYLVVNIASFVSNYLEVIKNLQSQLVASNRQSGGFQNAAFAVQGRVRGVPATPQQMREIVDGLSSRYATTLRHGRR